MEENQNVPERVQRLRIGGPGQVCPDRKVWTDLATGNLARNKEERLLDHAVDCDACGAVLNAILGESDDADAPEAVLAMTKAFRTRVAEELKKRNRRKTSRSSQLVLAAAAAVCLSVLALIGGLWTRPPDPAKVLGRAYHEDRRWKARIPYAEHAKVQPRTMAGTNRRAVLAEAEALILRQSEANPGNASALQLKGRLRVVSGHPDEAISELKSLVSSASNPGAGVLAELGMAHLAQAELGDDPAEYERALDALSRAVDLEPKDPVALFNRALALQGLSHWDQAEKAWNAYLAVESAGPWADEARSHLSQTTEKKTSGAPK